MTEKIVGQIEKVAGPLIVAKGMEGISMHEVVRVGTQRLIGEVIELRGDRASVQVYEDTQGVGPGEPVEATGEPLAVELAPGLIESIFDGIQRPLTELYRRDGDRIRKGAEVPKLDREKQWEFVPSAKVGQTLQAGDVLGTVQETPAVLQKIMVPFGVSGTLEWLHQGNATITQPIAKLRTPEGEVKELPMLQKWPVRQRRPYAQKLLPKEPMVTGQRVIDTLFPIAKGGIACVPGPFGSGKTVVQHQLAKWADADLIIYIGCGERGNEMTDVLQEFPQLHDPRTGLPLMKRTVLIANTSDMPVAAREASIYTGITIAEYFRDMGYRVAVIADSTSRWAEALREMSGRLEEMPGEEGYPAYLSTRLAEYYERAGSVVCLGSQGRQGAITAIGAVSPPGGDTSEPVSQATLRIVKVFWGLSADLAYQRHFPAIDWLKSYSLYEDRLGDYFDTQVSSRWRSQVAQTRALLQREAELNEIVRLVGFDALGKREQLILEAAQMIREDFLQQDAFREVDRYTSPQKQAQMLQIILTWYQQGVSSLQNRALWEQLHREEMRTAIAGMKYRPEDQWEEDFTALLHQLETLSQDEEEGL
ncbi:MAG TPA: V-type ATP synthase subunit A [Candidatus Egerieicola faecale]|uniref:V-type ATP synthase alpha chain n=1 Tax=Candidatus Egerieicola faecale TaxID=2840774 RepID=A0A9D1IRM7_9FIRM|nr:V-type ATP synthase subunit A [Candidatus Egerieicola faecale]